jgi:hypothetical protein
LESEIIQQRGFGEIAFQDLATVVETGPPADKVQQVVSIKAQAPVRQATYILAVQITIHPANLSASRLFNDADWALGGAGSLAIDDLELHD